MQPNKPISSVALVLGMSMLLSGCASFIEEKPSIVIPPTYSEQVAIPKATPTELKPLEWRIMKKAEMQKFLSENSGKDFVVYSLDDHNMKVLIGNMQELRRYIQEQQEVINYLVGIISLRREVKPEPKQ